MVIFHGFLGHFTRPGNHHVHHVPSRAWPIPWFQVDKNTLSSRRKALPSGNLTVCYWKLPIYSWFTYSKWWFSIAMLVYQRVIQTVAFCWTWNIMSFYAREWLTDHSRLSRYFEWKRRNRPAQASNANQTCVWCRQFHSYGSHKYVHPDCLV